LKRGKVRSYDAKRGVFDILYEDKDEEEVDFLQLGEILIMDPMFGDKEEHRGMTRAEVIDKVSEEVLIAAVAEEAMGSHGRSSYAEDRKRQVTFAADTQNPTAANGRPWRRERKSRIQAEQAFDKWRYDESDLRSCGSKPGDAGEKEMGYVYNASKCECDIWREKGFSGSFVCSKNNRNQREMAAHER